MILTSSLNLSRRCARTFHSGIQSLSDLTGKTAVTSLGKVVGAVTGGMLVLVLLKQEVKQLILPEKHSTRS